MSPTASAKFLERSSKLKHEHLLHVENHGDSIFRVTAGLSKVHWSLGSLLDALSWVRWTDVRRLSLWWILRTLAPDDMVCLACSVISSELGRFAP